MRPLIIDSFAGGGGASEGIRAALGRDPDYALNHDALALAMHRINHPGTHHIEEDVWNIDARALCAGRRIGLVWMSPDCKDFSKAKGGKPREKGIRGLAWAIVHAIDRLPKWQRPDVIFLENVEEFQDWGPLLEDGRPCPRQRGATFKQFVAALEAMGYAVEWRELRACDYGAPTIRKRLFLVARRDGKPIVWPAPTHAPLSVSEDGIVTAWAKGHGLTLAALQNMKPWRTAAECIDWSLPCPSIFDTSAEIKAKYGIRAIRPLADNTMARIAKGTWRHVITAAKPFIVRTNHGDSRGRRDRGVDEPMPTMTGKSGEALVMPFVSYGQQGGELRLIPPRMGPAQMERMAFNLCYEFGEDFVLANKPFALAVYAETYAMASPAPRAPAEPGLPEELRRLSEAAGICDGIVTGISRMPGDAIDSTTFVGWRFSDGEKGVEQVQALSKLALAVRSFLAAAPAVEGQTQAAIDVLAERRRQVEVEGYTPEHDDQHSGRELARAAACYALNERHLQRPRDIGRFGGDFTEHLERVWPWGLCPKPGVNPEFLYETWKDDDARRNLVKAGALILAEIDRLDRADPSLRTLAAAPAAPPADGGPMPGLAECDRPDSPFNPNNPVGADGGTEGLREALKRIAECLKPGLATTSSFGLLKRAVIDANQIVRTSLSTSTPAGAADHTATNFDLWLHGLEADSSDPLIRSLAASCHSVLHDLAAAMSDDPEIRASVSTPAGAAGDPVGDPWDYHYEAPKFGKELARNTATNDPRFRHPLYTVASHLTSFATAQIEGSDFERTLLFLSNECARHAHLATRPASPAPAALPGGEGVLSTNWLAEEFEAAEREIAAWPAGLRASFEKTYGAALAPAARLDPAGGGTPASAGEGDLRGALSDLVAIADVTAEDLNTNMMDQALSRARAALAQPAAPAVDVPAERERIVRIIRHAYRLSASYTTGDAADAAADAILAARPVAEGDAGWQPIETAPKDDRRYLFLNEGWLHPVVGYWCRDHWREHGSRTQMVLPPTHWQPLPAPPAVKGDR